MRATIVLAPAVALLLAAAHGRGEALPERHPERGDRVVIDTRRHRLTVMAGERVLRTFRVGLAAGGVGKQRRGDRKNPVGTYRLMAGRPSKFHRFLPISYPGPADARRGLAEGLITPEQAEAILAAHRAGRMPPQDTRLGGQIGIHGIGSALGVRLEPLQALHRLVDGSEGCFVLTDEEVVELERLYSPGAVLEIR